MGMVMNPLNLGASSPFRDNRPEPHRRNFSSRLIEDVIQEVSAAIKDEELAWMFRNCYPNTLDTTVRPAEKDGLPDTFVITGDIPAMWLRDSTAQVWPYLPFARQDTKLKHLLAGVVHRQTRCVLIDPYANAFNEGPTGSHWASDRTDMKDELHERKWEVDSLCYTIRLAHGYWEATGDTSVFTKKWQQSIQLILKTFQEQQRLDDRGPYRFERETTRATDTLPLGGYGNPTRPNGLIHSMFRPSDDACIYPFLIPSNLFAVVSLHQAARILEEVYGDSQTARQAGRLAATLQKAIRSTAIESHLQYGPIYAYEADGFGNRLFMDDANVPSLLALPYLGCCPLDDPLYRNTRRFVLSPDNPYFFKGARAEGIGGPHVGLDMIWPMSVIMRALTSSAEEEIIYCLRMLKATHAGTGFMHESFHKDNPDHFTRKWFAWANTLFGELIIKLYNENKAILQAL